MKRRIVLIRHAKSSWANPMQSDYDRPLNERGLHDAPMMGERLKQAQVIPDLIVSSTAKRAAQTARRIAAAVGYPAEKIQWQEKMYHCQPPVFEEIIFGLDDALQTVFMIAHNPGITDFANEMAPDVLPQHMPTCATFGVEMDTDHWSQYHSAKRQAFLFDYPKKHHG